MSLYPKDDTSDDVEKNVEKEKKDDAGNTFRLKKMGELEKYLKSEINSRRNIYKKYNRAKMIIDGVSAGASVSTVVISAVGVTLISTGIGAVSGLVLECVSALTGMSDMIGIFVSRKLAQKANKHHDIVMVAESKLNTLRTHISKALNDGVISEEEFKLVVDEVDKYNDLKERIRSKQFDGNSEDRDKLVNEAKEIVRKELIDKLNRG